jgi:quercetin dioxygenase-like cupin family protein
MFRPTALALGALVLVVGGAAAAMEDAAHPGHTTLDAAELKWGPAPPKLPAGAQLAVIQGDPGAEGPYVMRVKFPAGYKVQAHWHPTRENVTVLSGAIHVGAGDQLDEAKGTKVSAGGFISLPALMHHFAWTTEATEIQLHGDGPFALFYVDPANDPTSKKP